MTQGMNSRPMSGTKATAKRAFRMTRWRPGPGRGHGTDHEGAGRGHDPADVVAEPGSRRAQPGGEQLGQVVGEAAEDTEDAEADEEVHVEARLVRDVEPERGHQGQGRDAEVDREHRAATEALRDGHGQQGANEAAEVEGVVAMVFQLSTSALVAALSRPAAAALDLPQCGADDRYEGVAAPPGQQGHESHQQGAAGPWPEDRIEQLPDARRRLGLAPSSPSGPAP